MAKLLDNIPWARRLKLRHLEVFLTLHRSGSITVAAAELHMTQPAMSHWLADVEDVIGCPLFERKRRLEPTAAGEVLRAHAERMLGDVRRVNDDLEAMHAGLQGRIHLGTTLPSVLLPRAIARLQDQRPGIFVSVLESSLAELLDRLARREIDAVIGALTAQACRADFETEALIAETVQVVARRGHPLFAESPPSWKSLRDYPWILPPAGSVMRGRVDESFAALRVALPAPCVEASSSMRAQLLQIGERDYLSVLSASEVQLNRPFGMIESLALEPAIQFPDVGVIWSPQGGSATLTLLLDALRAEARVTA